MKSCMIAVLFVLAVLSGAPRAASFFENTYMVGASGSTVPVATFAIDGPAPWLYVNLVSPPGDFAFVSAQFFRPPSALPALTLDAGLVSAAGDQYWFAPSASQWASKKAIGAWNAVATLDALELVLIYGVGVGRVVTLDSTSASFSVAANVPEPSAWLLLASGLGIVAWRSRMAARRRGV